MSLSILITGGAGGLGSEAIKHLLKQKEEFEIHVVDNDKQALENLTDEVIKHEIDVRNYRKIEELSKKIEIDILVNCAGYQKQGAVEDMAIEEFQEHIRTNYLAAVNTSKVFISQLKQRDKAKIINVSSIAGKTGLPFLSAYSASKYALEGFTDSLRKELLRDNIQAVLVEPGRVKTGFNEEGVDNMKKYVPESRWSEKYQHYLQKESFGGIEQQKAGKKLGKIILTTKNKPRHTINIEAPFIKILKTFLPTRIYDKVVNRLI